MANLFRGRGSPANLFRGRGSRANLLYHTTQLYLTTSDVCMCARGERTR